MLGFFLENLDGGGAERAIVSLASACAERGIAVDLVVGDASGDYRSEVHPKVRLVDFKTRNKLIVFARFVRYLASAHPSAIMAALDNANIMLGLGIRLVRYRGRSVLSQRAVVTASLREYGFLRRGAVRWLLRRACAHVDAVISNSVAATDELQSLLNVPKSKITTIHNAVDGLRIRQLASQVEALNTYHFIEEASALIVTVGSLTERKDVGTIIRALGLLKEVNEERSTAHLVIVGKGPEEAKLRVLASELGVSERVHFIGFDLNPYKWMALSDVVVSASIAEGCPNVIAEALALGCAVVATDCPGDTAVLLNMTSSGRLVGVGRPREMAEAIEVSLRRPRVVEQSGLDQLSPDRVCEAYLAVLLQDNVS